MHYGRRGITALGDGGSVLAGGNEGVWSQVPANRPYEMKSESVERKAAGRTVMSAVLCLYTDVKQLGELGELICDVLLPPSNARGHGSECTQ